MRNSTEAAKSDNNGSLESIFQAAISISSAEERAASIRKSWGENHKLREQLEQLIQQKDNSQGSVDDSTERKEATLPPDPSVVKQAESSGSQLAAETADASVMAAAKPGQSVLRSLGLTIDVSQVVWRDSEQPGVDPIESPQSAGIPDPSRVASGNDDRAITLREVTTQEPTTRLKGHTGHVLSTAFSPDGKTVASASKDGTLRLWRAATAKEISANNRSSILDPFFRNRILE